MYKHILIATDGSEPARKAVAQGLALAKELKARLTAVMVTPSPVVLTPLGRDLEEAAARHAAEILSAVRDAARELNVPCSTLHVKNQFPAEGILATAEAQGCDLIVLGVNGGSGLTERLPGCQAARVLARSKGPVLVCC